MNLFHVGHHHWRAALLTLLLAALATMTAGTAPDPRPELAESRASAHALLQRAQQQVGTREYPDTLWQTAELLMAGHDFRGAANLFERYLHVEQTLRRGSALVNLAECQLALGRPRLALKACQECIDNHASDSARYRARLLAGDAWLELGNTAAAAAEWRANLDGEGLTSDSQEWRASACRLAELLATQRDEAATTELCLLAERVPDVKETATARYLIATALRRQALAGDRAQREERLQQARNLAASVVTSLRPDEALSPADQALRRNAMLLAAATFAELGQLAQAIDEYRAVIEQCGAQPQALYAYGELLDCLARDKQVDEAQRVSDDARQAVERLNGHGKLVATGRTARQWNQWLDTLTGTTLE